METYRAVEVFTRDSSGQGSWLLGSGFVLKPSTVVTAAHNLGSNAGSGTTWVRDLHGREWSVARVVAHDDVLDFAVLEVPGLGAGLDVAAIGQVQRETMSVLYDVVAVGFPGFKRADEKPAHQNRQPAHAEGWIPVAENYSAGELVLKVKAPPAGVPASAERRGVRSPWEGFSGSGVVVGRHLIGIVTQHRPSEGLSSLTVRGITDVVSSHDALRAALQVSLAEAELIEASISPSCTAVRPTSPSLSLRTDRLQRLTRRRRTDVVTFGVIDDNGLRLFGEGVQAQVTLDNTSSLPEVVTAVDLIVLDHDASYDRSYAVVPLSGLHLEVPSFFVPEPIVLNERATLDGELPVTDRQFALEPGEAPVAHHTLHFEVAAALPGLWELALRARYYALSSPGEVHDAMSDRFFVVKS